MRKISIIFVMLLLMSFCEGTALSLKLKRVVSITNEKITLFDIIESYEGCQLTFDNIKNTVIETLPYQRRMLNIQSNSVLKQIVEQNPEIKLSIANTVTAIRWQDEILSNDRLLEEASDFLINHFNLSEKADIMFSNVPRISIPSEKINISFEISKTTEHTNFIRLNGNIFYNGERITLFNLLARVNEEIYVYQSKNSIRKGEKINVHDFDKLLITANINNSYISDIDEQADIITKNFISKGSYLKTTDIVNTPIISRNETVTVLIRGNSMQISYEAVSRADGWIGDRIMLQNPDSLQNFYAVVIDKNKALIELE